MNITFNNFYIQIKLSERSRTRFKILIAYYSTLTLEVLFTFSNFDVVVVYIYFFRTLLYHYPQIEHIFPSSISQFFLPCQSRLRLILSSFFSSFFFEQMFILILVFCFHFYDVVKDVDITFWSINGLDSSFRGT